MTRLYALIVAIFIALTLPAFAQDQQAPNYDAWNKVADQTEQILESNQANEARLQAIRGEIVKWRDQFKSQEGVNSTRITTLKDQITALGPVPAEGQVEAEDVAARRKELNDQLNELQAPGLRAVEAFGRADSIITQIDQEIRAQQASALVRKTPSPLNPANWTLAMTEAAAVVKNIVTEVRDNWVKNGGMSGFTQALPGIAAFLAAALFLLTRGRRWIGSLPSRLSARASDRVRAALVFGVSLGQILIPFVGMLLLVGALYSTGLFGEWSEPLLLAIPAGAMAYISGIWLCWQLFPEPGSGVTPALPLSDRQRAQARFRAEVVAFCLAVHLVFGRTVLPLAGFNSDVDKDIGGIPQRLSDAAAGVWYFPVMLIACFYLFNLGNILRKMRASDASGAPQYRITVAAILGSVVRVVALVVPILAALGYVTAANALLWSTVLTLGLAGLLIVLQDFIADLYGLAVGGDGSARESLIPGLIGFALVLLSLPFFALIWGSRTSDLSEAWLRIQEGVSIGGITLSPMGILGFLLVFGVGYMLTRFVQGAFRNSILPKTSMDAGGQSAVISIIGYIGIGLAAMLAISASGINLTSLAVVAGALSVGIGFGLQQVVSNFVSGIILLIERPVAVGDWIEVGGKQGIVKKMAVRSTQIQTFDRTEVIVPNSDLITQQVTNWTRGNQTGRIIVKVGVAYGSDTRKVERILREIAEDQPTILIEPPPAVLLVNFGADSLDFEIRAVLSDINGGVGVASEIRHQIAERFSAEGIEIPFAQRDLWLRNPETLFARPPATPEKPAAKDPKQVEAAPKDKVLPSAFSTGELPSDVEGDADGDGDNT